MKTVQEETYDAINAMLELNPGYTKADAFRVYARQKEASVSFSYYEQQRKTNGRRRSRSRPPKAESTTLVAQPVVATPTVNGTTDVFGAIGLSLSQISAEYGRINRENRELRAKLDAIEKVCREYAS